MSIALLLLSFFVFTLAAVSAAGYVFVLRPARAPATEAEAPPLAIGGHDLPVAQAAVLDMFRLIGDAMPGRGSRQAAARSHLQGPAGTGS